MQPRQRPALAFFRLVDRLLRQIVTQHQRRVSGFHLLLSRLVVYPFLQQTRTIALIPAVKGVAIHKFVA